jgi:Cd2+/Zn2+-exporting ATPase
MIKKVVMQNLICTGCASRIEKALTKLDYIRSASFNFANQTMLIDAEDTYKDEEAIGEIRKIVNSIEQGVITYRYEDRNKVTPKGFFKTNWIMFLGVAIFLFGRIFETNLQMVRTNPFYWLGYLLITHKIIIKTFNGLKQKAFFNENMLMFIATLAAMFIEKPYEAMFVILFYTLGEHLQHRAVHKSKNEINALMDLHIEYANVLEDGEWVVKDPMSIEKKNHILVKNGEKIPVDGIIIEGRTSLNTSALTGESKLQSAGVGDYVLSGNINVGNVITMEAKKEYQESTIAKIIDLIENSTNKKSKTENFITKFAKYYTPFVMVLALLMFAVPTYFAPDRIEVFIFRAATFLVISCPCALVLSIPLSYFAGIGASARNGILFKGSNFLDLMQDIDVIGIDKTGTITHGNFVVDGYTSLETLKIAASLEKYSNHPIARSILEAYTDTLETYHDIEEIPGFGLKGKTENGTVLAGSKKLLKRENIRSIDNKDTTGTNIFVAKDGEYVGRIVVKDQVKESSRRVMKDLMKRYHIVMLTGDNEETASEVAYEVGGIDFRSGLLPEDKIHEFEKLHSKGPKMYVGDGINDAPLLKTADIGVAMGNGSELAIDVADIIIMDDDIQTLHEAFHISRKTKRIVYQNIVLSIGVKFLFLFLASIGRATMWMAIFADVGITMIAVLNALRVIYGKGAIHHARKRNTKNNASI